MLSAPWQTRMMCLLPGWSGAPSRDICGNDTTRSDHRRWHGPQEKSARPADQMFDMHTGGKQGAKAGIDEKQ